MAVKQRVECVEKFLLRSLLTTEKLNVVNQKKVGLAITFPEFDQITVLDRVDELIDEQLTRDIDHLHVFPFRPDELADGLHEMGLAETDAAVNEQRIIRARRRLRDGKTGCMRNFVVWTDDERFERVPRIESGNGCPWPRVYDLRRQRFLHRGCIVRRRLRTRCRRGAKLYRTGRAKCGDDRILQRRHVITLDPKLIDVVWNGKRDRFVLRLH